jgi:hypothetical protein
MDNNDLERITALRLAMHANDHPPVPIYGYDNEIRWKAARNE